MEKLSPAITERNIKRLCTLYNLPECGENIWLFLPDDFEGLKCLCIYTRNQELATFSNHIHVYKSFATSFFFYEELCFKKSFLISHRMGKFSFKLY